MPRRLAAVMSADVVGFTRLVRADEDDAVTRVNDLLQRVVIPRVSAQGGRVIKTLGDGFLAEFPSAVEAVGAALAFQDDVAAAEAGRPPETRIRFRVGINIGDVLVEDEDIFGDGVNLAARLQSVSDPDGVAVSQLVREAVRHRPDLRFADLGEQTMKNIEGGVRAYAVLRSTGDERRLVAVPVEGEDILEIEAEVRTGKPTIALMPFRNLSDRDEHRHLADGLRLGIQGSLVHLSGLFLINAFVLNAYRDSPVPAEQAANELGVRYILEGAVQTAGERVRVRLQLVDTAERRILWAERYDRDLADFFSIEDEITSEVINALGITLVIGEGSQAVLSTLKTREARDHFYRALSNFYLGTPAANAAARRSLEHVFEQEDERNGAPGNIAVTHWLDYTNGWSDDPARSLAEAERWAELAAAHPGNNGLGPTVLAKIRIHERRHDEAIGLARRGVRSRASCPVSHGGLATVMNFCGQPRQAIPRARRALALERAYPSWLVNNLAAAYRDYGDLDRARRTAEAALRLNALDVDARVLLCSVHGMMGNAARARALADDVIALDPTFSLSGYARKQPYRDEAHLGRVLDALGEAGLRD